MSAKRFAMIAGVALVAIWVANNVAAVGRIVGPRG